jgi:aerotaxis receptor
MKKPTPTGKEVQFNFDELFFSRTDHHGVILFGNDVFIRVSDYPKDTMIESPHNIVRHPDMPKTIFKLFWDKLKSNKLIVAYVKNLTANGGYYWVIAIAFPISGGYLSIRLRPSSVLFTKVKEIYSRILELEKKNGLEFAHTALLHHLSELGFKSYEDFMSEAIRKELLAKDKKLIDFQKKNTESDHFSETINNIKLLARAGSNAFNQLFIMIDHFEKAEKIFSEQTVFLLKHFRLMKYLSINMTASAEKFGKSAVTIGVIAIEFQNLATQIEKHLIAFREAVDTINFEIRHSSLNVSALRVQMDMVDFFVRESLFKANLETEEKSNAFNDLEVNRDAFCELGKNSISEVSAHLSILGKRLKLFQQAVTEINTLVSGLEVVRQIASVECFRNDEIRSIFESQIQDLKTFINTMKSSSKTLGDVTRDLIELASKIDAEVPVGLKVLMNIFELALSVRHSTPIVDNQNVLPVQ